MPAAFAPRPDWLIYAAVICLATELMLRLPVAPPAMAIMRLGTRAGKVVTSRRISDHWKERVCQAYALDMGRSTLVLTLWITVFVIACTALFLAADQVRPGMLALLESPLGILFGFVVSLAYYRLRNHYA